MNNKVTATLLMLVMLVPGLCIIATDSSEASDVIVSNADEVRLQIYGNANGDDYIDDRDLELVNQLISNGGYSADIYPFADANLDGVLDQNDAEVIRKIIDKEPTLMYYLNWVDSVSHVNYPVDQNIMVDGSCFELLFVTKSIDKLIAIDQSAARSIQWYNGVGNYIIASTNGTNEEHTIESLTAMVAQGVGTLIQWTGGVSTNYLWEMDNIEELTPYLNILSLKIQGPDCIKGVLMFAQMMGDIALADEYKAWYDEADGMFASIGTDFEKKTVSVIRCYGSETLGTYRMFGQLQRPALWFNTILNFQDAYVGKTGMTGVNSMEELAATATDEIVLMTQRALASTTYQEFEDTVRNQLGELYGFLDQYSEGHIYTISWEIMPFFGGPAGCYLLASLLYPDHFDLESAYDFLQDYLDKFYPLQEADARVGYLYSSAMALAYDDSNDGDDDGSGPATGDGSNGSDGSGDSNATYIAIVPIVIVAVVAVAYALMKTRR